MAKIVKNSDIVPLYYMKDGDLAEVINNDEVDIEEGTIIQRYENTIIQIGKHSGYAFPMLFENSREGGNNVKVRILSKGILIRL